MISDVTFGQFDPEFTCYNCKTNYLVIFGDRQEIFNAHLLSIDSLFLNIEKLINHRVQVCIIQ